MKSAASRMSTIASSLKSPPLQEAAVPASNAPAAAKLAASRMSIAPSRSVSPGAVKASWAEPSSRITMPTARPCWAAAVRDTIPVAPSHAPSLRPAVSRWRSVSATKPPAATVIEPLPRSSRPRASSASDVSATPDAATSSVRRQPARTSIGPLPRAPALRMITSPCSTTRPPVKLAAAVSTSVPAPRLAIRAAPLRTVESITVCPAATTIPASRVQVAVVGCRSWLPAASAIPAAAPASDKR